MSEAVPRVQAAQVSTTGRQHEPWEVDAELGTLSFMRDLLKKYNVPSDVTPEFIKANAITRALNQTEDRRTGLNFASIISCLEEYERGSVNKDAKLFNMATAFAMKPRFTIMGLPQGEPEQPKQSILDRIRGLWPGAKQPQPQPGVNYGR